MSRPIRAFVLLRCGPDDWSVSVCRDFEAVLGAWAARRESEAGILHIGFDRPSSSSFEDLAKSHPDRFLISAAAKFGLPAGYEASQDPIGTVEDIPIHLGIRGWGYEVEEEEVRPKALQNDTPNPQPVTGWVATVLESDPQLAASLLETRIFDDASYHQAENALPKSLRHRAGLARLQALIGDDDDPCRIVRAAPPWLRDRPVDALDLTVRISNVFTRLTVRYVKDIERFTVFDLLRTSNFGRKSVNDLRASLLAALEDGPFDLEAKIEEAGADTLEEEIERTLAGVNDRDRDILVRRMGLRRPPETLEAIAKDYGVTRERIRQIERKLTKRLTFESYWDDLLSAKLDLLLADREFPLPILGLEAVDGWFAGVDQWPSAFRYILSNFCEGRVGVVQVDGIEYVGFLKQTEWDAALYEAGHLLSTGALQRWTEEQCKAAVRPLIKETAREFRNLFWDKSSTHCHFVIGEAGERVLVSRGRGVEQAVAAILSESAQPLHFSQIAVRATECLGREVEPPRAQSAAAAVGILLGRGIYGAERHVTLTPAERDLIREEAESIVIAGPAARQWHASEIFSALVESEILPPSLDKYGLNYVLSTSPMLEDLGRMTWVQKQAGLLHNRIEIRQAVLSLLEDAGRPLRTSEIQQRLLAQRGVNETIQIAVNDPLIRLAPGLWGLNDRDAPIARHDQTDLIECLISALEARGEALHASELGELLSSRWPELTSAMAISLATLDPRLRSAPGQYLYAQSWGDPRRETLSEAVKTVLLEANAPVTLESVSLLVGSRLGRSVPKERISASLQSLGAIYNPNEGTWCNAGAAGEPEADDDFEDLETAGPDFDGACPLVQNPSNGGHLR